MLKALCDSVQQACLVKHIYDVVEYIEKLLQLCVLVEVNICLETFYLFKLQAMVNL